jgi:hypothetical protein
MLDVGASLVTLNQPLMVLCVMGLWLRLAVVHIRCA